MVAGAVVSRLLPILPLILLADDDDDDVDYWRRRCARFTPRNNEKIVNCSLTKSEKHLATL